MKYYVRVDGREHEVDLDERPGALRILVDGEPLELDYEEADALGQVSAVSAGRSHAISIEGDEAELVVTIAGRVHKVEIEDERERAAHAVERKATERGGAVKSVMPGIVVELLAAAGEHVEQGRPLLILEAMKMQNEIPAPASGIVEAVHVAVGQAVGAGQKLVTLRAVPE